MQFRRQKVNEEGINLTPLIDVVFLLLIFFMVSTTFTRETQLRVQLPQAEGDAPPTVSEAVEITIDANGAYSINGQSLANSRLQTLMAGIERVSDGNNQLPFIITADAKVPYEAVVTAMDAAGRLGFVNLSMTTASPETQE